MTTKPEPTILPVRPGTLDAYDKSQLRKAGVIVIEHENPAELRLMKPNVDISGNAMLGAAMKALGSNSMASAAVGQREVFFQLLTKIINGANAALRGGEAVLLESTVRGECPGKD